MGICFMNLCQDGTVPNIDEIVKNQIHQPKTPILDELLRCAMESMKYDELDVVYESASQEHKELMLKKYLNEQIEDYFDRPSLLIECKSIYMLETS